MNMTKITEEQKEEIKKMHLEGFSTYDIAKKLDLAQTSVMYWINDESRQRMIDRSKKHFKNKSPEEKREVAKKQKEYFAKYFKERYHNDPEFRAKHIERVQRGKK